MHGGSGASVVHGGAGASVVEGLHQVGMYKSVVMSANFQIHCTYIYIYIYYITYL